MIREGRLDDAAAMAAVFNHYVRTSTVIFSEKELSASDMHAKLSAMHLGDPFPFLVEERDGNVVGYCYAHLWHPDPVYGRTWEVTLYISSQARGHGIGTSLLNAIIEESRNAGAHTLISCVTAGNTPCERMLVKSGFEVAGCLKGVGYKFGQYLDDVFYQLILVK